MEKKESRSESFHPGQMPDTEYLQRELGDSLPRALAFVVELQPPDPISLLARCLYKYRALNPLPKVSLSHERQEEQVPTVPKRQTNTPDNRTKRLTSNQPSKLSIVDRYNGDDDDIDCIENTDLLTNQSVHVDIASTVAAIGDLFDDDDTR